MTKYFRKKLVFMTFLLCVSGTQAHTTNKDVSKKIKDVMRDFHEFDKKKIALKKMVLALEDHHIFDALYGKIDTTEKSKSAWESFPSSIKEKATKILRTTWETIKEHPKVAAMGITAVGLFLLHNNGHWSVEGFKNWLATDPQAAGIQADASSVTGPLTQTEEGDVPEAAQPDKITVSDDIKVPATEGAQQESGQALDSPPGSIVRIYFKKFNSLPKEDQADFIEKFGMASNKRRFIENYTGPSDGMNNVPETLSKGSSTPLADQYMSRGSEEERQNFLKNLRKTPAMLSENRALREESTVPALSSDAPKRNLTIHDPDEPAPWKEILSGVKKTLGLR